VSARVDRAGGERGYTLIELLVTMVILTIVVSSLTTVFVSGSSAQVNLNERFQAQQNARLALDRVRTDIHCASAAQAQTINTYAGIKLAVGNCYASTPTVSWCAVQVTASPPRYQLYRATGSGATDCTSTDATRVLIADYLTSNSVFTTAAIPQYSLQKVDIDLKVGVNSKAAATNSYELKDSIVARNSTRCTTGATCAITAVP
jgi:prepilin-type N-terminal cleavage/methylation domain-containing protein